MDNRSQREPAWDPAASASATRRQREILRNLKLELLDALGGELEKPQGFNPYDSQFGRPTEDLWQRRRRA